MPTNKSNTTETVFTFLILLKLALGKLATCKIIFQISEVPKTQITIFMSQPVIDQNLGTEDKLIKEDRTKKSERK